MERHEARVLRGWTLATAGEPPRPGRAARHPRRSRGRAPGAPAAPSLDPTVFGEILTNDIFVMFHFERSDERLMKGAMHFINYPVNYLYASAKRTQPSELGDE